MVTVALPPSASWVAETYPVVSVNEHDDGWLRSSCPW